MYSRKDMYLHTLIKLRNNYVYVRSACKHWLPYLTYLRQDKLKDNLEKKVIGDDDTAWSSSPPYASRIMRTATHVQVFVS